MVPPYQIPANPFSPANTDDFTAFQLHYALTADDLTPGDEDPFVERHEHGLPVHRFLNRWRELGGFDPSIGAVGAEASRVREWERPATIARDELQGDRYDIQGINWTRLETTRAMARKARRRLYPAGVVDVASRGRCDHVSELEVGDPCAVFCIHLSKAKVVLRVRQTLRPLLEVSA